MFKEAGLRSPRTQLTKVKIEISVGRRTEATCRQVWWHFYIAIWATYMHVLTCWWKTLHIVRHRTCQQSSLKLVRTPLNVYFTAFKSIFLSLCTYYLWWMSCLISFERCKSSCEERGTSEHYKKFLSNGGIRTTKTAPLVLQRVPLTTRLLGQLTIWH